MLLSCNKRHAAYRKISIDTTPAFLLSGLRDMSEVDLRNFVSARFGFHYKYVGGCVITKQLKDSIDRNNALIYKMIVAKNGNYWKVLYSAQLDAYRIIQSAIEKLLYESSELQQKNNSLFKDGGQVFYYLIPGNIGNELSVNAYRIIKVGSRVAKEIFYTIILDLKRNRIISIN